MLPCYSVENTAIYVTIIGKPVREKVLHTFYILMKSVAMNDNGGRRRDVAGKREYTRELVILLPIYN